MRIVYTIIAYLPIIIGIMGLLLILAYFSFARNVKQKNIILIVGCISIGICLLAICGLFFAGFLGLGPMPS